MNASANGIYRVGWLVDGVGSTILRDATVEIRDGAMSIRQAGQSDPGPAVQDWSSGTMLPGLIDSHVHLSLPAPLPGSHHANAMAQTDSIHDIDRRLATYLASGIVGVRDAGDRSGTVRRWRKRAGKTPAADVVVRHGGAAWHRPGRYGRFIGRTPDGVSLADAIHSVSRTVDHIKIIQSGINNLSEFGQLTPCQFSSSEMADAVQVARGYGLPVMVHANGPKPALVAIEAGCTSIEHGYFMDDACLTAMADQGTTWVPTLVPIHAAATSSETESQRRDVAHRMLDHQMALMRRAHSLGVPLVLGTDAGSPGVAHGLALSRELRLFLDAGIPLVDAIAAGTSSSASLLGMDGGRLRDGAPATFILVPGVPDTLPANLSRIQHVSINGRFIEQ